MKRVVFIIIYFMFVHVAYAQLTNSQVGYLEKKVAEAEAKAKKEQEAKKRKERKERIKTERRHEQQRRQHEANYNRQMINLNQVSASDFINSPQLQEGSYNTKVKKFREDQQNTNVPISKEDRVNQLDGDPFGNSDKIGTPSYSGLNYTGNRYNNDCSGFDNIKPQIKIPTTQIRGKYKPNRNMRQGVTNLQRTNTVPKVHGSSQKRNIAQRPQKQRDTQDIRNVQAQQKQQIPVREKLVWIDYNGNLQSENEIIKNSSSKKPVYLYIQQTSSSPDLAKVDTRRIDYATKVNNITIYNMPDENSNLQKIPTSSEINNEASYLSDKDNKIITKSPKVTVTKTDYKLQQMAKKDMMNGMGSFDNRQKWERIYDYEPVESGLVKIPARSVTKKNKHL